MVKQERKNEMVDSLNSGFTKEEEKKNEIAKCKIIQLLESRLVLWIQIHCICIRILKFAPLVPDSVLIWIRIGALYTVTILL